MRSEADTPIEQRYLWLEGIASPTSLDGIKAGLPSTPPPDSVIAFVGFAYDDISYTKQFDAVFPRGRPQDGMRCVCRIVAATQQMGSPFPAIPKGWKTICMITFDGGVPPLVQQLPIVDAWYQNQEWVCICDEATWEHLKRSA